MEDVYQLVNLIFKFSGQSVDLETVQEWFCDERKVDFRCFLQSLVEAYAGLLQVGTLSLSPFSLSLPLLSLSLSRSLSLSPSLSLSLSPSLSLSLSLSLSPSPPLPFSLSTFLFLNSLSLPFSLFSLPFFPYVVLIEDPAFMYVW